MKYKMGLTFICLIICLFSVASVCASDANQTVVASDEIGQELNSCNENTVSTSIGYIDSDDSIKMSSEDGDTLNLNDNDEKFEENKINTVIIVSNLTTDYKKWDDLIVTLKDDQNHPISMAVLTYNLNGTKYDVTDENGQINIPTDYFNAGTYYVNISFAGNQNYTQSTADAKITVNKIDSILNCGDPLDLNYGTSANITVGVDGVKGIIAKIDEKDVDVIGNIIILPKLDVGTYILSVTTIPEDNYNPVTKTKVITVNKVKSSFTLSDVIMDYGGSSIVKLFPSGATSLIAKIDGKTVNVNGDEIMISGLSAGNHTLSVTAIADEYHTDVTKTATITVNKVDSIIGISDINVEYGSSASITVSSVGVTKLTAKIDDESVDIVGNTIMIPIMDVGIHTLSVTSTPDSNHNSVTKTAKITVNKINVQINLYDVTLDYGSQYNMTINLAGSAKFTAKIDEKDVEVIGNRIIFPKLNAGTHTLTVSTVKDANHDFVTNSSKITINKVKTTVLISNLDATVGKNIMLTAGMECVEQVNEGLIVFYDGKTKIGQAFVNEGIATLNYTPLIVGIYYISAIYGGTSNYEPSNSTFKLTVSEKSNSTIVNNTSKDNSSDNKDNPIIVIPSLDGSSGDGPFEIKFPDDTTGTLTLTVDGKDYAFDIVDGVANIILPELGNGDYYYIIKYSGDSVYNPFTTEGRLKINNANGDISSDTNASKPAPKIIIPPLDQSSQDKSIEVKLPSDASGSITLKINNTEYSFTVVNGVANVVIPDLEDGNYSYAIKYSGDSKYSSFTKDGRLNVNKTNEKNNVTVVDKSKILASNVKVTYANGKYYTIKVYGADGKLANGVNVIIKVNGKIFKTLTTANGIAKFKVTNVPGTYKMNITALNKSLTKTLKVAHLVALKSVTVKKSAKKLVLQAVLGKVNGKYLSKKTVTFKFNGKKYTAKTNSKGVAKVTIKSNVLKKLKVGKKVTYQATYLKDTVKKRIAIKK